MKPISIPIELRQLINPEQTDFIVKSSRNYPLKKALPILFLALFFLSGISVFVIGFIVPILSGEEVHFEYNGEPTTGSLENFDVVLAPILIISLFFFISIGVLILALILLLQKGGYFVATETRFIKYRNGKITIKDWEQFSGNIRMRSKSGLGNLELELRNLKNKGRNSNTNRYVPEKMYMSGIKNVFEIEKKCRFRIEENASSA